MQVPYSQQPLNSDELELIRACQLPPDPEAQRLLAAQVALAKGDRWKVERLLVSPDDQVRSPAPGFFRGLVFSAAVYLVLCFVLAALTAAVLVAQGWHP